MPDSIPSETPPAPASPPKLLTCAAIAKRIAKTRGQCHSVTVWRAIKRLGIAAQPTDGPYKFFTEADAALIENDLRKPNSTAMQSAPPAL